MILDGWRLAGRLYAEWSTGMTPHGYLVTFGYDPPPLDQVAEEADPLPAAIAAGIWVAYCPCQAATSGRVPAIGGGVVFFDDPLVWCPRCRNASCGGRWRRVAVPPERYRAAVERLLMARPDPGTRNWRPDESLAALVRDNRAHGIEEAA